MTIHKKNLEKADIVVSEQKEDVSHHQWRLKYHVMPAVGWMNDPNGFSFFNGEYHLFYQHHPFSPEWGPMHWGKKIL
jgi:beta-fructofuranosidase